MCVRRGLIAAAGLGCALMIGATSASADTIIKATYKGTLTQFLDPTGLFGAPTVTPSAGVAFIDTFTFDLEKGVRITNVISGRPADNLLGGSIYYGGNPMIDARLTINGHAVQFGGNQVQEQFTQQGRMVQSVSQDLDAAGVTWFNDVQFETDAPSLLTTPYSGSRTGDDFFGGFFTACGSTAYPCTYGAQLLEGYFETDLVSISVNGVVAGSGAPEPDSWALMVLGFSGLGIAFRRQLQARPKAA